MAERAGEMLTGRDARTVTPQCSSEYRLQIARRRRCDLQTRRSIHRRRIAAIPSAGPSASGT
jgi:hypothetical protein